VPYIYLKAFLYLDFSDICQASRSQKPSQGEYILEHTLSFRQLKHMKLTSFDRYHTVPVTLKTLILIALDYRSRRRITCMHTKFL
jgi:hypothetical protein